MFLQLWGIVFVQFKSLKVEIFVKHNVLASCMIDFKINAPVIFMSKVFSILKSNMKTIIEVVNEGRVSVFAFSLFLILS